MLDIVDWIRTKHALLRGVLDERAMRLWAAAEAGSLGHGGAAAVREATGIGRVRIRNGLRELAAIEKDPLTERPQAQRIRRPGAGRKRLLDKDPELREALEKLIEPATRGAPDSPLRWTSKSKAKLTTELRAQGFSVGATTVGNILRELGYSLQVVSKTREGTQHPERDAQFRFISVQTIAFMERDQPVVSVDTKKKELVGDFKNAGREWQPKGEPAEARVHDFVDKDLGKVIPYGVYDLGRNEAWVSVGVDHDTAAFAVNTLTQWWITMGKKAYPGATELLVTADGGGSNSSRSRLWKARLQEFSDQTRLTVTVAHFPPGTSKWNKIEHRLFSHITQNWRGRPLETREVIVSLIAKTTTSTGLRVKAKLDKRRYPTGTKVPNSTMKRLAIAKHPFQGMWNYTISPRRER